MKNSLLIISLFILSTGIGSAQVADYAMEIMTELSDTAYHGRGYYEQGDLKAARYIAGEYKNHGLQAMDNDWFQHFTFPVNTFQADASLKINGKAMQAGEDFVLRSFSGSAQGVFDIYMVDTVDFDEAEVIAELENLSEKQLPVCDYEFARQHKDFYRKMIAVKSGACLMLWDEPLRYYKAYSDRVYPSCIAWISYDNWPDNAKTAELDIDNHMIEAHDSQNVIGCIEGKTNPDDWIVFTAHYDHLGMMGRETFFPGANDNASGVAMLLNLAKHYGNNPPEKSLAFICVAGEECGLLGSEFYVKNPAFPLEDIELLINLDMVADNGDSLYVQCNKPAEPHFNSMKTQALRESWFSGFKQDSISPHSDHFPFVEKDVPAIFFSIHGEFRNHYHTPLDNMAHVSTEKFIHLYQIIREYIDS